MSLAEIEINHEMAPSQLKNTMENIKSCWIFDPNYLDSLKIVEFGYDGANSGIGGANLPEDSEFYPEDFIRGRTTDFVVIYSKADYDKIDLKETDDHHAIVLRFISELPPYDGFVAHEIAHNFFDLEYEKLFGEYEEKDGMPAVSDEYSNKMRNIFSDIILAAYPNLEINKFEFNRQQICEIFAMLFEREFCKIKRVNTEVNLKVEKNCRTFMDNPEDELLKFNSENNRDCQLEDFYSENHILSLIAVPLIEDRYADFSDRLALFWE